MSLEQGEIIRQEDIIINDDEFVLPPEPKASPVRRCEIWGTWREMPADLRAYMEEIGVTHKDTEFCEFQEYDEEERGVVGDALRMGSHCTIGHLDTVWYNYCLAQWFCQMEGNESPEDIDFIFDPIHDELQRLREHPELFPSHKAEQVFWNRLKETLKTFYQARSMLYEHDRRHIAFVAEDMERLRAEIMPSRDAERKPWEQFLHNRAPGISMDLSDMGDDGSIQILPMGALRLLHEWKTANESIIRRIEAARRARGDGTPYQVGLRDPTLLAVGSVSPEGHRRTHNLMSDLLRPIRNGSQSKPRPFADTELEMLNEDFGKGGNPPMP